MWIGESGKGKTEIRKRKGESRIGKTERGKPANREQQASLRKGRTAKQGEAWLTTGEKIWRSLRLLVEWEPILARFPLKPHHRHYFNLNDLVVTLTLTMLSA